MTNNYTAMERLVCEVCGDIHSHNAGILLHKRLKDIKPDDTITGYGLCRKHQLLFDEGYIALIAADSPDTSEPTLTHKDAARTGQYAHVRREAFDRIFGEPLDEHQSMVYVEPEVIHILTQRIEGQGNELH